MAKCMARGCQFCDGTEGGSPSEKSEAGFSDHPLFYTTTIEQNNVYAVLTTVGLTTDERWASRIDKVGWSSAFIHLKQANSRIPLALGKVVFHNGRLSHIKWYCEPDIDDEHGAYYYRLLVYLNSGVVMTDYQFNAFRKTFKAELEKVKEERRRCAIEEKFAKLNKRRGRRARSLTPNRASVNSQTALNSTLITWLFKGCEVS